MGVLPDQLLIGLFLLTGFLQPAVVRHSLHGLDLRLDTGDLRPLAVQFAILVFVQIAVLL